MNQAVADFWTETSSSTKGPHSIGFPMPYVDPISDLLERFKILLGSDEGGTAKLSLSQESEATDVYRQSVYRQIAIYLESHGCLLAPDYVWSKEGVLEAESSTSPAQDAREQLAAVKVLVEIGLVPDARRRLSAVPTTAGQFRELETWRKALTKPEAQPANKATGGALRENSAWLRKHTSDYRGEWIALRHGVLVGSHENRAELRRIVKDAGKLSNTMFFRIEK